MHEPATPRSIVPIVMVVIAPLLVALVALLWRPWAPVLDMAMTELRVRDVGGRFTPRIGLPGRIGNFPDQGSHPGPWSFVLVAPFYRLAGATAWGMQLGSVVINSVAFATAVFVGHRMLGRRGALLAGCVVAIAVRGFGLSVLTHPWNPYFPLALWMLLLVAAWAVLLGHHRCAIVVAACGSIAAQTHVPYLVSCVFVSVLVLGVLVARWRAAEGAQRRTIATSTGWALGVSGLLWLPPIADQLRRDPGNLTMLYRHFTGEPTEPAIGWGTAIRVFLRHLDVFGAGFDLLTSGDAFVRRSGRPYDGGFDFAAASGFVTLLVWAAAALIARRRQHRALQALNRVLAVALVAAFISVSRIFGKVWFYLTLWAWVTMLLVVVSIGWAAWLVVRERLGDRRGLHSPERVLIGLGGVMTVLSLGAVVTQDVPEPNLSDGLRAVTPATVDALSDGTGAAIGDEGRYLVFWQDSVFIGAQGYGLVNELERRGFDVGVHPTWRVPVTHHRVLSAGAYDAEVHLVSGQFIEEWRRRDGFVEVANVDVRTAPERRRFSVLRDRVGDRLQALGRTELLDVVDGNLFGASLDPELPNDVVEDLSEMLLLGEPVSVFIAPPNSSN